MRQHPFVANASTSVRVERSGTKFREVETPECPAFEVLRQRVRAGAPELVKKSTRGRWRCEILQKLVTPAFAAMTARGNCTPVFLSVPDFFTTPQ
jgi:hypothetical protein